ncbi:diguanylate cyclase [Litoribacillus peritrichatus]
MNSKSLGLKRNAKTCAYFLGLFAISYSILLWQISAQERRIISQIVSEERAGASKLMNVVSRRINDRLDTLSQMTFLLSDGEVLLRFLEEDTEDNHLLLTDAFRNLFLLEEDIVDIRLVNAQGKDLLHMRQEDFFVRLLDNEDGHIHDEPYFHELRTLSMNSVGRFLGGFVHTTLTDESGYRNLALRLIAPVYDGYLPVGYIVVSIAFNDFLKNVLVDLDESKTQFLLLSEGSHYLYGVEDARLFGHELAQRAAFSLAVDQPAVWQKMQRGEANIVSGDTYYGYQPMSVKLSRHVKFDVWAMVLFSSDKVQSLAETHLLYFKRWRVLIIVVALSIAALGSWFRTRRSRMMELSFMAQAAMKSMSPIVLLDTDGCVKRVNPQFSMISGYQSDEVVGKPLWGFSSGPNNKKLRGIWETLIERGSWEGEVKLLAKDGSCIDGLLNFFPFSGKGKKNLGYVGSLIDISAQKGLERRLRDLTVTDALTGCKNRRFFDSTLATHVENLKRNPEQMFCLAIADIDFFKKVNDDYGHDVGDEVLQFLVQVIEQEIRNLDVLCRVGGEEFAIILPNTHLDDAFVVLERLRQSVEDSDIQPKITCSIGVVESDGDKSADDLYRWADEMLYRAKQTGRNKVVCASDKEVASKA